MTEIVEREAETSEVKPATETTTELPLAVKQLQADADARSEPSSHKVVSDEQNITNRAEVPKEVEEAAKEAQTAYSNLDHTTQMIYRTAVEKPVEKRTKFEQGVIDEVHGKIEEAKPRVVKQSGWKKFLKRSFWVLLALFGGAMSGPPKHQKQ